MQIDRSVWREMLDATDDLGAFLLSMRQAISARANSIAQADESIRDLLSVSRRLRAEGREGMSDLTSLIEIAVKSLDDEAQRYIFDENEWSELVAGLGRGGENRRDQARQTLGSILDRSRQALVAREKAAGEIERVIGLAPSSSRSALGREALKGGPLHRAASVFTSLGSCADQMLGESGVANESEFSHRRAFDLARGGPTAVFEVHRRIADVQWRVASLVFVRAAERDLALAWQQLSSREPAFRRLAANVFPDGDGVEPVDLAAEQALSTDLAELKELAQHLWISAFDDLMSVADRGGSDAFVLWSDLHERSAWLTEELDGGKVLLQLGNAFSVALAPGDSGGEIDGLSARDVKACRREFFKWVDESGEAAGAIGALLAIDSLQPPNRPPESKSVWRWMTEQRETAELLAAMMDRAQQVGSSTVVEILSSLPSPSTLHVRDAPLDEVVDLFVDAQNAAREHELMDNEVSRGQLVLLIEAMRDVTNRDPSIALQLEALAWRSLPLQQTDAPDEQARSMSRSENVPVASLDHLVDWTLTDRSPDDLAAEVDRVAYRNRPLMSEDQELLMTRIGFSKSLLRADLGLMRILADGRADVRFGVNKLLEEVQHDLVAALKSDPTGALERQIARCLVEGGVAQSTLDAFSSSQIAPTLVARMVEEGHPVPDSFRRGYAAAELLYPHEAQEASDRITIYSTHVARRLVEEQQRLIDVAQAFDEALRRAGESTLRHLRDVEHARPELVTARALADRERQTRNLFEMLSDLSVEEQGNVEDAGVNRRRVATGVVLSEVEHSAKQLRSLERARRDIIEAVRELDVRDAAGDFTSSFFSAHLERREMPDAFVARDLRLQRYAQPISKSLDVEVPKADGGRASRTHRRPASRGRPLTLNPRDDSTTSTGASQTPSLLGENRTAAPEPHAVGDAASEPEHRQSPRIDEHSRDGHETDGPNTIEM